MTDEHEIVHSSTWVDPEWKGIFRDGIVPPWVMHFLGEATTCEWHWNPDGSGWTLQVSCTYPKESQP